MITNYSRPSYYNKDILSKYASPRGTYTDRPMIKSESESDECLDLNLKDENDLLK